MRTFRTSAAALSSLFFEQPDPARVTLGGTLRSRGRLYANTSNLHQIANKPCASAAHSAGVSVCSAGLRSAWSSEPVNTPEADIHSGFRTRPFYETLKCNGKELREPVQSA